MNISAYELLHAGYATELERTRPIQHEIRELSQLLDKVLAEVARLEDLRRWRPMSELPRKTSAEHDNRYLGRLSINPSYIRPVAYDFEEQEWGHPRHHEEEAWEWTYIPGQEPTDA